MSNEERNATNPPLSPRLDEDGISPEHLRIRGALQRLPKRCCPVGFEFRLQKRLESGESALRRPARSWGWSLGWMGAGAGVVTALAVAIFAFDFQLNPGGTLQVAGVSAQPTVSSPPVAQQTRAVPQTVSQPDVETHTIKTPPVETSLPVAEKADKKLDSKQDSLDKLNTKGLGFPEAQTVSGQQNPK